MDKYLFNQHLLAAGDIAGCHELLQHILDQCWRLRQYETLEIQARKRNNCFVLYSHPIF